MRCWLAALLLTCVDAVYRRSGNVLAVDQVTKSWSSLVSELWSELIIEEADKPIDFAKSDKAVKDQFLTDCVVVLDVHTASKDDVGKIVAEMCSKAGGKPPECAKMTKTLWEAHKDKKLKPWCEETFTWFTAKTKPRCLKKCKALLCKDRCDQSDKVNDLSDEIAAHQIKLDTASKKEKRLEKVDTDLKATLAKIQELDKTKCGPAGKDVKKLADSRKGIAKDFGDFVKAVKKASGDKDKDWDALKKLKLDKKSKKGDIAVAQTKFDTALDDLAKAKGKQVAQNKKLIDIDAKLTEAKGLEKVQCKKVKDMQDEYDADKKTYDGDVKAVAADKKKHQDAMDKVIATKKKEETALKAALK